MTDHIVSPSLTPYTTFALASELAKRKDLAEVLVRPDGLVPSELWPIRAASGTVGCVDAIAIRFERKHMLAWSVWGGVIRRNTGRYAGKLCLIGGVVAKYESIEDALKRHWKSDLGLDVDLPLGWEEPMMRQYAPQVNGNNRKDFCHDPGKHSYASTHIVTLSKSDQEIRFNAKIGGQEASGFEWHTADSAPPEDEWGYNMRPTFLRILEKAARLRVSIQIANNDPNRF